MIYFQGEIRKGPKNIFMDKQVIPNMIKPVDYILFNEYGRVSHVPEDLQGGGTLRDGAEEPARSCSTFRQIS